MNNSSQPAFGSFAKFLSWILNGKHCEFTCHGGLSVTFTPRACLRSAALFKLLLAHRLKDDTLLHYHLRSFRLRIFLADGEEDEE